ncbi:MULTISPECIES: serine/threonine-protein kinase [Mycolicibacterium]|uniref:non-specific serine/threonine protein kinase n=2 Tax=Mycolicibacterium gilvum TaxID=1804 RepID=E6TF85_MYCSR|nr:MULTISPECIES: serine/threonine-protein kinase [Mycolicibacterium]ADT97738.1 protein kinase family protein [Mycolicibacterium gilvum Spyr1]MBV5245619.1 serine/threonine protein kinase [Mycolicibacterium sp. PAM1]
MQAPEVLGGRYRLGPVLGRGGMAEVRDAWDQRLGRPVAVKLLYPSVSTQPDTRRRFATEARAAAALNHPHVVAVHDTGVHEGRHYIVLERLPGQNLADLLARHGPLPVEQVRAILRDVLSALSAAHLSGVLHRDIKPANILFTEFGGVKIADFGVAKSPDTPQTLTNRVFGTMAYLPSDRIAGRPATPSDDLYALGVVAYEALTGRRAYPQDNLSALADAIAAGRLAPLTSVRPDVDPALAATIERAIARDPRWRFATAEQMRRSLDPPPPRAGRAGAVLAVAAILLIVALVALLVVA